MKKIISFLPFMSIMLFAIAQPNLNPNAGLIVGKVFDANNNPLQYVSVFLYNEKDSLQDGVMTDAEGKFVFMNVPYGQYIIEAKFVGFKKKRIKDIEVSKDNRFVRIGKITILAEENQIGDVTVTGQKNAIEYKIDKKVVNVSKELQGAGGNATDVLQNVPSVTVDIEGNVSLRGSSNFTVMINGKPSILEGNDALQQIPASSIEKIEIITNPSAKYDPDGVAGIINIITKQGADKGLSGKIEASADTYGGYNGDVILHYKTEKFDFFIEGQYRERIRQLDLYQKRISIISDSSLFNMESTGQMAFNRGGWSGKGGFSYFINNNNTLTISGEYGLRKFDHSTLSTIASGIVNSSATNENNYSQFYKQNSSSLLSGMTGKGDIDFEHKFNDKGHKIRSFVQASYWKPFKSNILTQDTTDFDGNVISSFPYMEKTEENRFNRKLRFQTDYELPLSDKTKFEAGSVVRLMHMNEDYNYFVTDNKGNWMINPEYSTELSFFRNILAGYVIFSSGFKWFDFQLGLRSEFTDRKITDKNGNAYTYKKTDFFPSLHLSKQLPSEQQIQFGYSRRIRRPYGWFLNPSPMYIDTYTIQEGNPALKPEYTNSFELNYLKKFGRSSLSIETYFRQTTGKFDRYQRFENQKVIYTWENINNDYAWGTELMTNLILFKFIMLNLSANGYYNRLVGTVDGVETDKGSFEWTGRSMIMTMLPGGFGVQLGGFYRSPSLTLQGQRSGFFMTFAGLRKSFLKRKLMLSVSASDLFNTAKFEMSSESSDFYSVSKMDMKPSVRFTISYRINNFKQDRKKNNGNDEDAESFVGEGMY